jgi:Histidine kinase-, DNA gyrase B-, and HSP90-like ATPase
MYERNQHTDNNNSTKIDKKLLDALYEFIHSTEFEIDMMLPGFASLQFLSYYKITDYMISQKLSKNIIIRMLCPLDEDNGKLTKQLVPFIGYKLINPILPKTSTNSLFFIRDKQDIFSFSIDIRKQQQYYNKKGTSKSNNKDSDTMFFVNDWSYCKNVSIVRNMTYCFNTIWEEKENYERIVKEKKHSELLFDVVSHDIGNYHQILLSSLEVVTSLFQKNNNNNNDTTDPFSKNNDRILSCLTVAKNALTKSQSLVDNIRRLERLHTQKEDLKVILKNLPDAIDSSYSTVQQSLYKDNHNGKRIRISINLVQNKVRNDINIIAEDLLEEIFINLFSNCVKYTDSTEVKIDVLIKDYFIGETKYWMITISDHGKGIPDPMKKRVV